MLDVVQEFTTWCGMEINVKKTFLLIIDKDRKRRESTPAPDLRIKDEYLKTVDINESCRYLSYWGTGNGDMCATREVVLEKARVARDLTKSHPLTPERSAKLFAQKGIGAFWFSAALIEWSQSELEGLQKESGYKSIKMHGTSPFQDPEAYSSSSDTNTIIVTLRFLCYCHSDLRGIFTDSEIFDLAFTANPTQKRAGNNPVRENMMPALDGVKHVPVSFP